MMVQGRKQVRGDPTLQFALNHNWEENITLDGAVLRKQFQMSWLLSRSQWRVNSSALASTAVLSLFILLFWKHGVASRLAPVTRHPPFSFAISAVIAQPLLEHLGKNVSIAQPLYANVWVGTRLFSFGYITHACSGWLCTTQECQTTRSPSGSTFILSINLH